MGFTYLKDKNCKDRNWNEITRDERFFTSHLYFEIHNNIKKFIKFLNTKNPNFKFDTNIEWEISLEVCFYRDYLHSKEKSIKKTSYSQKRTFDLCLFSENQIVIIEAKAQQPFVKKQIDSIKKDKEEILLLLNRSIEIYTIALCSSKYIANYNILDIFNTILSWKDMYELYNEKIFLRADDIYKL